MLSLKYKRYYELVASLTNPMKFRFNLYPSVEVTHLQGSPTLLWKPLIHIIPATPRVHLPWIVYIVRQAGQANFSRCISLPN